MNEKQRAALMALRDVMMEHDIHFDTPSNHCMIYVGSDVGDSWPYIRLNPLLIEMFLQQENEL